MTPLLLALSLAAHADLVARPPRDKRYSTHNLHLENLEAFPDLVFLAIGDGETVRGSRVFTVEEPTQELGRGTPRGSDGLFRPRIRAVAQAEYDAWRAKADAAAAEQREACFERGEGCVHPSRFEVDYPPLEGGVFCSPPIAVQTTAPRDAPPVHTDAFRVVKATASECELEEVPAPPAAPEAPEPAAQDAALSGATPAPAAPEDEAPGCSSAAGAWTSLGSVSGGLSLLVLLGYRRR